MPARFELISHSIVKPLEPFIFQLMNGSAEKDQLGSGDDIKSKVAKALLKHQDSRKRRMLALVYAAVLVALYLAHAYSCQMASPLKIIPQSMCAIGIGYLILLILSIRRFQYVVEFIDWTKVKESAAKSADGHTRQTVP